MKVSPIQANLYSYSNNKNQNTKNDSTSFGFTVLNEKALVRELKIQKVLAKLKLTKVSENLEILVNEIIPKFKAHEDKFSIKFLLSPSRKYVDASLASKETPKFTFGYYGGLNLAAKDAKDAEQARKELDPDFLIENYKCLLCGARQIV